MQARVFDEVLAGGGGDGGDVADVLHHGRDGDRGHDQDGRDVEFGDDELLETKEACFTHTREVDLTGDDRDDVGADDAEQDGDDLDHALAPDVGDHDDGHSDEGEPPAGGGIIDGGAGEVQADHDDHRARDDGREVTHDLFRAEHLEEECEHEVEETCDHDAAERVGELRFGIETFVGGHRRDRGEAAEVGERGAEERGDLELGAHVEQQRAETGEQQCRLDGERQAIALDQNGDEHRRAKHGEHVLQAQDQHSGGAQLSGVVDGFVSEIFLHVIFPLCFLLIFILI